MKSINYILLSVVSSLSMFSCDQNKPSASESSADVDNKKVIFTLNEFSDDVDFHTDLQLQYLKGDYNTLPNGVKGMSELSVPNPVRFDWSTSFEGFDTNPNVSSYKLYISENDKFENPLTYACSSNKALIYNLKIHTTYYYKVETKINGVSYESDTKSLRTSDTPIRNLFISGVTNVRDLGGYMTNSGKYVKQGVLYRSGRFNLSEATTLTQEITNYGIYQFKDILKLKTEVDLRHSDDIQGDYNESGQMNYETHSLVGEDVAYKNIHITYSTTEFYKIDKEDLKEVFLMIADSNNLPLCYHCDIGTDRTGLISVAILGLMGVSMDDIYRDYMFSNFGLINASRNVDNIKVNVNSIKTYPGETFQEQTRAMLKDKLSLTDENLDAIYNNLIEK